LQCQQKYCCKNHVKEISCNKDRLISYLKHDHRMPRNYLSGTAGNQINTLLAAAAYNMRKWMRWRNKNYWT
jgi:hypothetical protein